MKARKRFAQGDLSTSDPTFPRLRNRRDPSVRGRGEDGRDELAELRARPAKSIQNRYVVNLEDGRKYRMLTSRTLARFGLTPREYRVKWGLPLGQPLLARSLLVTRRRTARELGLGEKLRVAQREAIPSGPMTERGHEKTREQAPRKKRRRERSSGMAAGNGP